MPHIRGPRSALVSFKCPKKEIQFSRRSLALPMPHGHALIKKSERKKSGQNNVGTKNWPTGDGCSRPSKPQAQKTEIQIQNWGPRPRERVQNKNFYLNGKNQQMQRKTI